MASSNGSAGGWNPVEGRALKLGPVWAALLFICPHSTGVWELSLGMLSEAVGKLQINKREPTRSYIRAELAKLEASGHLKLYDDGVIWIKDRWSYNTYRALSRHRTNAKKYLASFPNVIKDFIAHDITYDITNPNANAKPVSQKQKENYIATPSQASESSRATGQQAGGGGGLQVVVSLQEAESQLPENCKDGWSTLRVRIQRKHSDPRGIPDSDLAETLVTILDGRKQYKLTDDQLKEGFDAANRNQRIAPLYVINAARGITQNKTGQDGKTGGSKSFKEQTL